MGQERSYTKRGSRLRPGKVATADQRAAQDKSPSRNGKLRGILENRSQDSTLTGGAAGGQSRRSFVEVGQTSSSQESTKHRDWRHKAGSDTKPLRKDQLRIRVIRNQESDSSAGSNMCSVSRKKLAVPEQRCKGQALKRTACGRRSAPPAVVALGLRVPALVPLVGVSATAS